MYLLYSIFFDKNGISYHRLMNLCKFWNGHVVLKMYPTWTRSSNSEIWERCEYICQVSRHKKR